ncbi:MAG: SURF1 family protein [Hyphomicrobiaceae bacterium]|nr:SURF1 family protein [Hyphomicrobiaceae bacterium]
MSTEVPSKPALLAPTFAMLVVVAILMVLGTWQVERLKWKTDLIARATARAAAPAGPLPAPADWDRIDFDALDYTPVRLQGRFDNDTELHVFSPLSEPRGRFGGPGYLVLSPFILDDGNVVLVNRGFVPEASKQPASRPAGRIDGPTVIEGLLRRREPRDAMTPADARDRNVWFVRDARVMAAAVGLDPTRVAPFTVDARASATPPGGLPQAGETRLTFTNNHLGYAITWYGLALCCLGVYLVFIRSQLRRRAG